MTRDELLFLSLLLAFAVLVTAHVAIAFGLARRKPRWKAILALAVVPLAPYWGARSGMHVRTVAWVVSALVYVTLRLAFQW
jgi:hypothetical protein